MEGVDLYGGAGGTGFTGEARPERPCATFATPPGPEQHKARQQDMDHQASVLPLTIPATALLTILAGSAAILVEPYSSQPSVTEKDFMARWKEFLLGQAAVAPGPYVADLPFSCKCVERSSREWVRIETARADSGDWQEDGTRTHVLTWKDAQTSLT